MLGRADERGVDVRGLVWRSHSERHRLHRPTRTCGLAGPSRSAAPRRSSTCGSAPAARHHQKLLVIRHRDDPTRDIAYVGGIDLCHSRRDDADARRRPAGPGQHGGGVRRHPAVARHPGRHQRPGRPRRRDRVPRAVGGPHHPEPQPGHPAPGPAPPASTPHPTRCPSRRHHRRPSTAAPTSSSCCAPIPNLRHGRDYDFARGGERSVARGYTKAVTRARHLLYVEDQYLWGDHVGEHLHRGAARAPRPPRDRGGADSPGRRGVRPDHPAAGPGARDARHGAGRARPGRALRHREPRGHAGLRARQDLHRRRHLGDHRLGQLQPPLVDPRLRALGRRGRHRRRLRPDAEAHAGRRAPRPR